MYTFFFLELSRRVRETPKAFISCTTLKTQIFFGVFKECMVNMLQGMTSIYYILSNVLNITVPRERNQLYRSSKLVKQNLRSLI